MGIVGNLIRHVKPVLENLLDIPEVSSKDVQTMTTHAELIRSLGGGTKVAKALTAATGMYVDREKVYKWKDNGVAWHWRPDVTVLARTAGVTLPDNFNDYRGPHAEGEPEVAA